MIQYLNVRDSASLVYITSVSNWYVVKLSPECFIFLKTGKMLCLLVQSKLASHKKLLLECFIFLQKRRMLCPLLQYKLGNHKKYWSSVSYSFKQEECCVPSFNLNWANLKDCFPFLSVSLLCGHEENVLQFVYHIISAVNSLQIVLHISEL